MKYLNVLKNLQLLLIYMLDVTRFYIRFPLFIFSISVVKILSSCLSQQTLLFFEKYGADCSTCTTYKGRQW